MCAYHIYIYIFFLIGWLSAVACACVCVCVSVCVYIPSLTLSARTQHTHAHTHTHTLHTHAHMHAHTHTHTQWQVPCWHPMHTLHDPHFNHHKLGLMWLLFGLRSVWSLYDSRSVWSLHTWSHTSNITCGVYDISSVRSLVKCVMITHSVGEECDHWMTRGVCDDHTLDQTLQVSLVENEDPN